MGVTAALRFQPHTAFPTVAEAHEGLQTYTNHSI